MMETKILKYVLVLIFFIHSVSATSDQVQGLTDDEDIDKPHKKTRRAIEGSGINPCDDNDCHADADCLDVSETTHECRCKTGFYGNGKECMRDLCQPNPCPANRKCQNILGNNTYDCDCKNGWVKVITPDGETCSNRGRLVSIFGKITCVDGPNSIFDTSLTDKSSKRYRDYQRRWCRDVAQVYTETRINRLFTGCSIVNFRRGSVEVSFESYFTSEPNTTATDVITEAQKAWDKTGVFYLQNQTGLHLFGEFPVTPFINVTDLDECEYSSVHGCDVNAFCTNTVGSYNCTCYSGYVGDGFNCTDYNECDEENSCGPESICVNIDGSFTCMKRKKESCMVRVSYILIAASTTLITALIPLAYYAWFTKLRVDGGRKKDETVWSSWGGSY